MGNKNAAETLSPPLDTVPQELGLQARLQARLEASPMHQLRKGEVEPSADFKVYARGVRMSKALAKLSHTE